MKRGEVWWVNFGGSIGGEIQKNRPAIILSNDAANQHANRIQVIPVTSQTAKLYPCEALVTVKGQPAKALADQIMTMSKQRIGRYLDVLAPEEMRSVERAVRIQLGLAI